MNWLHYLLEANLYLGIFYAMYCLFLNKETHYTLNRVYLLLSCIISFVLPVIQIGWLKALESPTTAFIIPRNGKQAIDNKLAAQPALDFQELLLYAYILGTIVLTTVLLARLYQLAKLTKATKTLVDDKYKLISIEGSNTAFSFFNYLFIGTKTEANNIIIRHELVHIRQKHSADIVFLELIKIINWFNPLIYLLQISLKTLHEYIADEQTAAQESDALSYSSFLVSNAYGLNGSALAHSFFNYNLLKKRIIMLNQKRSGKLARLKYLVAVPISAGLLCASTLVFSKSYGFIDLMPGSKNTSTATVTSHNPIVDTSQVNKLSTTAKGYKYEETGYLVNKKTDFRVIITEKNGEQKEYFKSKATPEELATLKSKYGYTFPKMMIYPKLPPPPPAPPAPGKKPKVTDVKLPPPPPPANPEKTKKAPKVVEVQEAIPVGNPVAPAQPSASVQLPPPPPPADPMAPLYKYIAKHVRYPAAARNNRITGQVTVGFKLSNGKINGVKVLKTADPQIDKEVARVVSDFDEKLDGLNQGDYTLTVALKLIDSHDKYIANNIDKEKSQVVVVGYVE
ncbi:TonB family C-terminal domain-containing protein [Mucilaginibacter gossypiicola]|uniref:TonB family C-terminal domain-containing protein n=1 Tax=Mucilaginibacter gossypiicola TaxID=551995 RepID=A0A1H8H1D9_9SPHI|nr:M56 family metallopeptidase [Mucilaginibacter gossypiicola]SEN50053.1 TonB family C-terminal domain-containing protein [Mucilaginibacter gossypiicola]